MSLRDHRLPSRRSNAIGELRRLHDAIDRAVLDAYGWKDIGGTCEFELECEVDKSENGRQRRKPWRYRWPEPVRDEVLARLLALNAERAEEERLTFGRSMRGSLLLSAHSSVRFDERSNGAGLPPFVLV